MKKQGPIPDVLVPYLEGKVLLLDKPLRWTSFKMIRRVRGLTFVQKVGHAGPPVISINAWDYREGKTIF